MADDDRTDDELLAVIDAGSSGSRAAFDELVRRYPGWATHGREQAEADVRKDLARQAEKLLHDDFVAGGLDAEIREDGTVVYHRPDTTA
jgi:hypothetical protein